MNVLAELRSRYVHALSPLTDDALSFAKLVKPAQDSRFGDFQANCAMPLAKKLGISPRETAERIVANLDVSDLCELPQIAGPGFINLSMRNDWMEGAVNRLVHDERFGVDLSPTPKTIVVDYSGPNL